MISTAKAFFSFLVLFLLQMHFVAEGLSAKEPRPNIIVILIDDMGMMDTSVPFLLDKNGAPQKYPLNDFFKTPNMERLAKQGIRFNQFYSNSVCSPTRTSIVTGQSSARHHTTNWINPTQNNKGKYGPENWNWKGINAQSVTLPRLLSQNGYVTQHIGKGHFGPQNEPGSDPVAAGFNFNIGGTSAGQPGSYYGKDDYGNLAKFKSRVLAVPHLEKYHGTDTCLTEALTLEAKSRISSFYSEGKPFFLYFAHYAVHAPFMSDPRFSSLYKDSSKPEKAKAYASMISGMDKSLGDILDHVNSLGIGENTLVIFLGDNGSDAPLGETHDVSCAAPLRGKKGTHYEGGMRAPFIAAWAKPDAEYHLQKKFPVKSGAVQTQVATVMDIMPTILEITNVSPPGDHPVDGKSLTPLFTGNKIQDREESFLMHYPHEHRSNYFTSFRLSNWKLTYHYYPEISFAKKRYELFNLKDDPFEEKNLSDSQPEKLLEMMKEMINQLKEKNAQFPVAEDLKTPLLPVLPEIK